MPRPRTRTINGVFTLTIWLYPDSANATCKFSGDAKYVTTLGDIILVKASRPVHIIMAIQTRGYSFDPVNPIVITDNLAHKGQPGHRPNNFTAPILSMNNTQVEFDNNNQGNKHFYYSLNFIDPGGHPFPFDPIIINN